MIAGQINPFANLRAFAQLSRSNARNDLEAQAQVSRRNWSTREPKTSMRKGFFFFFWIHTRPCPLTTHSFPSTHYNPPPSPSTPLHSLDSGVARCTETFTRAGVAAGTMAALARQLAALAVGARCAEIFAAPATEAWGAHAGTGDGVAQGTVLALAAVAAVWAPVVAVTACKRAGEREHHQGHTSSRGQLPWARDPGYSATWHLSCVCTASQDASGQGCIARQPSSLYFAPQKPQSQDSGVLHSDGSFWLHHPVRPSWPEAPV